MRHGDSMANQQGIVISDPTTGTINFGLSELGKTQVSQSLKATKTIPTDCIIISSDFTRARQTADITKQYFMQTRTIQFDIRLRERFFGDYEGGDNSAYEKVWLLDKDNADDDTARVESANAVTDRSTQLILDLEKESRHKNYLLISHGDTLQLLQTAFLKAPAKTHRTIKHLNTAEIRELTL